MGPRRSKSKPTDSSWHKRSAPGPWVGDDVGQAVQRWDSYDAHRGRWGAVGPLDVRPQGPVPGGDLVPHILEQEGNLLEDIGPPAAHLCTQLGVEPYREGERGLELSRVHERVSES